jgi:hypothetical protein
MILPRYHYWYINVSFGIILLLMVSSSEMMMQPSSEVVGDQHSRQLSEGDAAYPSPNKNHSEEQQNNENIATDVERRLRHARHDPRTIELKTHHTLNTEFKELSNALRNELTDAEWKALNAFSRTLRESHCQGNGDSFLSLNTYVHSQFTLEERIKWMNPMLGVVRSINQESNIPCEISSKYWVPGGSWQSVPMWGHCCNKGSAIAKCPSTPIQETPSMCNKLESLSAGNFKCYSDGTLLCEDYVSHNADQDCLVYTFGIANEWDFEDWIGSKGCEVHAHDPTTRFKEIHEGHEATNVHFHYEGLGIPGETATNLMHYGDMGGPMKTLGALWREHGHAQRRISILKIDCEGCEFEAFHQLAVNEPEVMSQVCTIIMELHFSETLQMKSAHQLKRMASFWQHYVEEFGFRFWYLHENPGSTLDQRVNPLLLDIGMDPTICCYMYEIALRRPDCDNKGA